MLDVFRTADHAGQIFIPHRIHSLTAFYSDEGYWLRQKIINVELFTQFSSLNAFVQHRIHLPSTHVSVLINDTENVLFDSLYPNIYIFQLGLILHSIRVFSVYYNVSQGAVHKVRHARGGGGTRKCDSLWQGEWSKSMWRHTLQNVVIHVKREIESDVL